ncbi:ABC transporter ATP-binding protein [Streptomyces sp. DSM 44917]|uniref:ABC transporter ATP-binding protein n=1 Tax=Streptomyces boetiae TaxID=3075541 RepID=A0ABU2LD92_9ACTN|nr:ABC transporter ATP-binding protein [Streptomyces sp. DSM 44917]MDT0309542.1 ABC transporter ATP-binding protein [Streptomyces sp. DSM 44917]
MRATARHGAARAAWLLLLGLAETAAALLLPAALARAVDTLLAGAPGARRWALACAGLAGAQLAAGAARSVLAGTTDARAAAWLRGRLIGHALALGPRGAAPFAPGDLATRATLNAAHAGAAPAALAAAAAGAAAPVGGLLALALLDWRLAAVLLAGLPLLALLLRSFARSTADALERYQRAQAAIAARLVEATRGATTIAAAGTLRRERDRVLAPLPELSAQGHRMWHVTARATGRSAALSPLLQLAVLATAGLLLSEGQLSTGGLLAAARYASFASAVGVCVGHVNRVVQARGAGRRIGEVLAAAPVRHGEAALPRPGAGRLRLRGVTAARDGRLVLDGLDLDVPGGATLAVVGRSGTGKSLLAAMAGRLADPDAGEVLLDGVPLRALTRRELREAVGYAFERPALLGGTLAGTIGYGPARPAPGRVAAAARSACADAFIRTLPEGYDTPCADAPLSGGELQRLGLARAFAHDGRLLILDDATSSLDTVTELRVGRALMSEAGGRTRLVVAHRAATAARADLVAWLDGGRVRALGPHHELWRLPEYRALWASDEPGAADEGEADEGEGVRDGRAARP